MSESTTESTSKQGGYQGPGHYRVKIEVVSQGGHCANGHKVGDSWIVEHVTPGAVCMAAFSAMFPVVHMLEFGGGMPWKPNIDEMEIACPDAKNPVVFRLSRLRE